MIKKKICLLGYFAVGKTSLVRQFVFESFSEKYHTTIGVKIDKKEVLLEEASMQLLIWDIHGEDRFQKVQQSYLIGAAGFLLVIDSTREESLPVALELKELVHKTIGDVPFLILLNKCDLVDEIVLTPAMMVDMGFSQDLIIQTSAKTGQGVEYAFLEIAKKL
ncbi:MAG: Rab family GTPase [Prolixibacteraceae bacterium]